MYSYIRWNGVYMWKHANENSQTPSAPLLKQGWARRWDGFGGQGWGWKIIP